MAHAPFCNRIRTRACARAPVSSHGNEFSARWISGWIKSDDPRRRPFKRRAQAWWRWRARLFGRVVWSYQQDDRAGGAMTGHDDDDFDSQTRTPITPGLGCYPRSDVRSPSWPCISCTNNALFSAYTFCWRICLFRNMIAAILFPVYVYYPPCSTCRRITCRFTTIPSANINPTVYRSPATWISLACVFNLRMTIRLTIDAARSKLYTKSRYTIFLIFRRRCNIVRKGICFDVTRLKRGTDCSIQRYVTFSKK